MKVAPISADLLVKLALGAAVIGAAFYAVQRVRDALPSADRVLDTLQDAAQAVNPASRDNLAYTATNAIGGAIAGDAPDAAGRNADGSWSLGGWLYDKTH